MSDQVIWPQIVYIILISISFATHAIKHGEIGPRVSFWRYLFSLAIALTVLYSGGFFAVLGWSPK